MLGRLFDVFGRVAIARSTISRLQNWGQHVISTFSPIAKEITQQLKDHIRCIYQPSFGSHNILDLRFPELNEYKEIIKNNDNLLLYSDDAPTRLLVYEEDYSQKGMTSLDLIEILRNRDLISKLEGAKKIATLCSWNVSGVWVKYMDILRVISQDFTGEEKPKDVIEKLGTNEHFNRFINYIWNFRKVYKECLEDIANFVSLMIPEERNFKVPNNIVEGIWYKWYLKVALKTQAENNRLAYLARSFLVISQRTFPRITNQSKVPSSSQKLWCIYKDLVELVFADDMTDEVYNESIILLAQFAVNTHPSIRDDVYNFIKVGLVEGTSDWELFRKSYQDAAIKRDMKGRQRR